MFHKRFFFKLFFLVFLLTFIALSPLISSAQIESAFSHIISSGKAAIVEQNQAEARNKAIENAMRMILEYAVNLIVDSERIINNYELLRQEILESSSRYIQSYKIFYENPDISLNTYEVALQATVPMGNLKSDLVSIGLMKEKKHKPRLMIMIEEDTGRETAESENKPTVSEVTLLQSFSEEGFEFVDQIAIRKNVKKDQIAQAVSGNDKAAVAAGLQFGADIVIVGKAVVKERLRQSMGTTQRFVQANITARAIDVNTGSIMLTGSEYNISSAEGEEKDAAYSKLLKDTSRKLSRYFIDRLTTLSPETREKSASIYLTINDITVSQLAVVRKTLKKEIPGILGFLQKSYINRVAQIELEFTGDKESLINEIITKNYENFQIKLAEFTENKIHLQVLP